MLNIKEIKAALFDMDGLIADTEALHVASYHKMADHFGIKLDDEYIHSFIGVATKDNVNRIIKDFKINRKLEDVLKLRYDYYLNEIEKSTLKPMDGSEETILLLKEMGIKIALVTSSIKEHATEVLKKIFPGYIKHDNENFNVRLFDLMIFGNEVKHPKPHPEIYLKASTLLNINPTRCLVFEDSEAGVISAKSAGMYVIAVPNYHTKNQNFNKANLVIPSLTEFKKIIEKN